MHQLQVFLTSHAPDGLLPWGAQEESAERFGLTLHQVEEAALAAGILPARYQRNGKTLSVEQQYKLFKSRVAVMGCGGLGGYILEELARLGVGDIVAVDFDVFEEHNLNRQLLSCPDEIGRLKVDAAAERVAKINPAVKFTAFSEAFATENGPVILEGVQVAVDALDSVGARLALVAVCKELKLPFVHGAICGWYGQVATQYPGDGTVEKLYRSCTEDKGMEKIYGNPSFTPAVIASLQVAEVCKVLLDQGKTLRNRVFYLNLLDMELEELQL
ncbi:HesA/MoeB/ThiF family protein [Dethiobacter alkaliphilus]|uniref:HesA/MoeB/ThiF family protein n=1 Tax=Dethiobacter alkaliphilus TaxID=427926 RepID=UPI002226DF7F|nr:HesA/MoeB/ThiF family protein [Dethiobacter alkaliphilus]MCW3489153.1 HesA/MoeB/ThiF family protein [Dethiobacter alkaliphilus]